WRSNRRHRARGVRAIVALMVLVATASGAARRPPCADGRFLTADGQHVVADITAPARETIVLDGTSIAIEPACARITYAPRHTRRGTIIRAVWRSCDGIAGSVKLRALQPIRSCDLITGTLNVKNARPKHRRVRATRAPYAYDVPLDPLSPWPKFRRT